MQIEKVSYQINWKKFKPGYSFLIPCLDPPKALEKIHKTTKRLKYKTVHKIVIEDGVQGIRVWRV